MDTLKPTVCIASKLLPTVKSNGKRSNFKLPPVDTKLNLANALINLVLLHSGPEMAFKLQNLEIEEKDHKMLHSLYLKIATLLRLTTILNVFKCQEKR